MLSLLKEKGRYDQESRTARQSRSILPTEMVCSILRKPGAYSIPAGESGGPPRKYHSFTEPGRQSYEQDRAACPKSAQSIKTPLEDGPDGRMGFESDGK